MVNWFFCRRLAGIFLRVPAPRIFVNVPSCFYPPAAGFPSTRHRLSVHLPPGFMTSNRRLSVHLPPVSVLMLPFTHRLFLPICRRFLFSCRRSPTAFFCPSAAGFCSHAAVHPPPFSAHLSPVSVLLPLCSVPPPPIFFHSPRSPSTCRRSERADGQLDLEAGSGRGAVGSMNAASG